MRHPWGLNERLFAAWYPCVMGLSERAGGARIRADLLATATGRTLEIGAGNGYNLPHYPAAVTELVVSEPSPYMVEHLRTRLEKSPPPVGSWDLVQTGAEALPFDDNSFDTVVAAYVHCTIPDPAAALREIHRVLRDGGRYLFLEHVRDRSLLGNFQDLVELPHTYLAAGCHPNRRTEDLLEASPLTVERIEHGTLPMGFPTVRPTIRGIASRSA
jgi:SAM-dependent methyltransferase